VTEASLIGQGALGRGALAQYLAECRKLVLGELRRIIPEASPYGPILYHLMLEYPLRSAKALRPAICIAACRALGGRLEPVLPSAAVLELYHNAFLIHDDVEDLSEKRRDEPTLHATWGMPIAMNVGDAMLALALSPLLDNMRLLGMGKALRILQAVALMSKESAEGQAMELMWVRENTFDQTDDDYERMVEKKTSHYSFVTPAVIGATIAEAEPPQIEALSRFAMLLGVAFQIQDDILNIAADEKQYGKEIGGDLWEGKHTLLLLHALRGATEGERAEAIAILQKPRPNQGALRSLGEVSKLEALIAELSSQASLSRSAASTLTNAIALLRSTLPRGEKTEADVRFLMKLITRYESVPYARQIALRRATDAAQVLSECSSWLRPSVHRSFLEGLVDYVIQREK